MMLDYMGNPFSERATRMSPGSEVVVRPSLVGQGTPDPVGQWFTPNGFFRRMREEYPTSVDTAGGHSTTVTARVDRTSHVRPCSDCYEGGLGNCSFADDPVVRTFSAMRFCSPSPDYDDADPRPPEGGGGYWCLRSTKYHVTLYGDVYRGWSPNLACITGEGANILTGYRVEGWLLDQYFDESTISWNNPPPYTGYKFDVSLEAVIGYETGIMAGTTHLMLEVPDLADGSGPVKIYGIALLLYKDPYQIGNERATATMTVQAYRENSRRGTDSETGTPLPPISYPQFVQEEGYRGEWARGPWLDPKPWTWNQLGVEVVKNTPTTITMVGLDADAPNSELTYSVTSGPTHGTLGPAVGGDILYTPTTGFTGADQFQWRVSDYEGRYSNTSLITISVANP